MPNTNTIERCYSSPTDLRTEDEATATAAWCEAETGLPFVPKLIVYGSGVPPALTVGPLLRESCDGNIDSFWTFGGAADCAAILTSLNTKGKRFTIQPRIFLGIFKRLDVIEKK